MATATATATGKKKGSAKSLELLNKQVADLGVLYMKLHSFHWNVKGPGFFTLHAKFEELYNEITLLFDEAAERLIAIGGKPVSTMKGMLSLATIKEASEDEDANAMVRILIDDFYALSSSLTETAEAASKDGDDATADIVTGMSETIDKHRWMLEAFRGE